MSREQEIQSHWTAIEATAEQCAQSLGIDYPVIPLVDLKTHWDAVVHAAQPARDKTRLDALLAENLALKKELAVLKRRFGIGGDAVIVPRFLQADRGTAN